MYSSYDWCLDWDGSGLLHVLFVFKVSLGSMSAGAGRVSVYFLCILAMYLFIFLNYFLYTGPISYLDEVPFKINEKFRCPAKVGLPVGFCPPDCSSLLVETQVQDCYYPMNAALICTSPASSQQGLTVVTYDIMALIIIGPAVSTSCLWSWTWKTRYAYLLDWEVWSSTCCQWGDS